jgi:hypothetical protein
MKILSIFASLIYASVCFAQLNTVALESTLNSTLTEVVGYFDFIENGNITIDHDYTNVDLGRVKVSIGSITTPLDSNANRETGEAEALTIAADLITDLTNTEDGRKLFTADANVTIGGNTMSVLKSVADVYGECEIKATNEESPDEDVNGNILCVIMDGFRSAENVVGLEKSIQTAANIARDAYGDNQEAGNVVGEIFSSLKIVTVEDSVVLSFDIMTGENKFTAGITDNLTATVVMTIKESGVTLNASGSALLEIRQVEDFTDQVKKVATELANRDSETHVTYYEDNLYLVFGLIEAFLIVEDDEDFDGDFEAGESAF